MLLKYVHLRKHQAFPRWLCVAGMLALASVSSAADVVVVCADSFRESLEPWCQLRRAEGLKLAFCRPSLTAEETSTRVREAADPSTRYVVLVGDAPDYSPRAQNSALNQGISHNQATAVDSDRVTRIPAFYLPAKVTAAFGSTPTYPADLPYGDLDGDGITDAAVGRLPVVTPDQLADLVHRLLAYELSQDFGVWRRSFQLTAGVGGFGMLIDGAIESVTRSVLTSVLPADAKPQIAYASPGHAFCPPEESFSTAVLGRYRNGSRFWVYAGHGSVDQLNFLSRSQQDAAALSESALTQRTTDGQWRVESLLDNQTVTRLVAPPGRAPIAILLACYAGAYDAPGDCLSERMLLTPGGPVSVIAASRLTMPYGNARFGLGLLESAYHDVDAADAPERLGDAMRAAVRNLQIQRPGSTTQMMVDGLATLISPAADQLADERSEHAGLYQLFGDPTLNLQSPQQLSVTVNAAETSDQSSEAAVVPSHTVCVNVTSPIAGRLTVCVDRPLTAVSAPTVGLPDNAADDPHGCTLGYVTIPIEGNVAGITTIPLPEDWSGPVVIRGFVQGREGWASGSARTVVD
ncbi:hypothetical protein Poly21_02090 [Allorhodopirellula heiligendammensis]|uniref:Gingipain domain-containing protein n=1 Tax=Allorhodopirellula heiligendammensis TaxID=2714739 RepID=A0A5C6C426_9BACT|nr:hypothetical protein Poly21_02090 [Allorhodopirellula heiligendammensis]